MIEDANKKAYFGIIDQDDEKLAPGFSWDHYLDENREFKAFIAKIVQKPELLKEWIAVLSDEEKSEDEGSVSSENSSSETSDDEEEIEQINIGKTHILEVIPKESPYPKRHEDLINKGDFLDRSSSPDAQDQVHRMEGTTQTSRIKDTVMEDKTQQSRMEGAHLDLQSDSESTPHAATTNLDQESTAITGASMKRDIRSEFDEEDDLEITTGGDQISDQGSLEILENQPSPATTQLRPYCLPPPSPATTHHPDTTPATAATHPTPTPTSVVTRHPRPPPPPSTSPTTIVAAATYLRLGPHPPSLPPTVTTAPITTHHHRLPSLTTDFPSSILSYQTIQSNDSFYSHMVTKQEMGL
ncbi:soluble scavenger receptor cysteine-rich domain-containing protein SSC5D-like [Helianthus annuus]|uniref:soluble scavenger receptor cysteine-rich domain-containing protein SSC5D-like n=1 Tax=Helianthus annuus TaxID=4232 RepID=UPI000B8F42C2|nr:soluble scavenger receptor cysteine-rich domain-containing protein SSC5D-like [Helianthus annuus]